MEYFITHFGITLCCVIASVAGGLFNYNTRKLKLKKPRGAHINWLVERKRARQELGLSIVIAVVSAEFFIPPLIHMLNISMLAAPAIAFILGYSGIRLLPAIEHKLKSILEKGWK